ncbi:hypothetical protein [Streptomyces sp. NPDC127112]|uniref:hypothetical protein n=1 Tax=Streptomyces sp. NPDC127112 TaxID=3345364 RepID=UPI00363A9BDF
MTVGVATVLVAGPAWASPHQVSRTAPAAAALSNSDLEVVRLDPEAATPGGTTTIHGFVGNLGPETTASPFVITVSLPHGVTPEKPYWPDTCVLSSSRRQVHCEFGAGLKKDRSATALVPVRLDDDLNPGTVVKGGWVSVRSLDDRNPLNNRAPFEITVVETAPGH